MTVVAASLAAYFFLSLNFFPMFYTSHITFSIPRPFISNVTISESEIHKGKQFEISIIGTNEGDDADIEIISISFPNLTSVRDDTVKIIADNFIQKPLRIAQGDSIGSNYRGLSKSTVARYPSVEFYSRPWKTSVNYHAQLQIRPPSIGMFVMFLKAVALPHTSDSSHYPQTGFKDEQQEFVESYQVKVKS